MKYYFTFALLWLISFPTLAQINSQPIPGGIRLKPTTRLLPNTRVTPKGFTQPSNGFRDQINQVFANVDSRPINTGLLWDYGLELTDVLRFDGTPRSNNKCTLPEWRIVYGSLTTMQFTTSTTIPELATINERIRQAGAGTTHALVALHVRYDKFRSDATSRGVSVNNNRLTCDNTRNPYQTKFAFAAALENSILQGRTHSFRLASNLFINRSGKTLDRIEVDPGKGSFRTVQLNTSFTTTYSNEGEKTFKVRMRYTDGTTVESHSPIYVKNIGPSSPVARYDAIDTLQQRFNETNEAAGALVTVEYAGNDQVLDKPFIVAEGFDAWRIISPDDPRENFSFEDFIGAPGFGAGEGPGEINIDVDIDRPGQTINDFLEENDYDLVFIDYEDGTAAIERNAEMMEDVIEWVNAQKPPGSDDNVVLGMSMGGLVARMALREMEVQGEDHQTRLYISHDAPHQGANVPVAAQAAVLHLASTAIGIGVPGVYRNLSLDELSGIGNFRDFVRTFFQGSEPGDIAGGAALLYAPATRQLLPYAFTLTGSGFSLGYDNSAHNDFMTEYRNLGYPQQTRNIAIASGSECAPGQVFSPYAELLRVEDAFISTGWFGSVIASVAAPFTNAAPHLLAFAPLLTTRTDLRGEFILNALPSQQS